MNEINRHFYAISRRCQPPTMCACNEHVSCQVKVDIVASHSPISFHKAAFERQPIIEF